MASSISKFEPDFASHGRFDLPAPSGIISFLPPSWVPVAQLIRLDKPGFVHFFVPLLTGALLAADVREVPVRVLATTVLNLFLFSLPLTFINFSWNDTLDVSLDRKVRRTRTRPIASGAITLSRARAINLLLLGLCVAALWPFPTETWVVSIPSAVGAAVYPLTKRWTMFPQVFFGAVMAMGVVIGASAAGLTPFIDCDTGCRLLELDRGTESVLWLYAANVAWGIGYEIVYSFQDVEDDKTAGSGTIALLVEEKPMPLLWCLAILQTFLFAYAGMVAGTGPAYFVFSVVAMGLSMALKLRSVDLKDPESCIWWFSRGVLITGGLIVVGLLVDSLAQRTT